MPTGVSYEVELAERKGSLSGFLADGDDGTAYAGHDVRALFENHADRPKTPITIGNSVGAGQYYERVPVEYADLRRHIVIYGDAPLSEHLLHQIVLQHTIGRFGSFYLPSRVRFAERLAGQVHPAFRYDRPFIATNRAELDHQTAIETVDNDRALVAQMNERLDEQDVERLLDRLQRERRLADNTYPFMFAIDASGFSWAPETVDTVREVLNEGSISTVLRFATPEDVPRELRSRVADIATQITIPQATDAPDWIPERIREQTNGVSTTQRGELDTPTEEVGNVLVSTLLNGSFTEGIWTAPFPRYPPTAVKQP